jgi:5-methylcytosine-specific restriction endonuclease McrA
VTAALAARGTTNSNVRGSAEDRRRRREWLLDTYRANVDVIVNPGGRLFEVEPGSVEYAVHACRCYRCGQLLVMSTVTVDRIIPGCKGGTYRRDNIRPACSGCNSETGGKLGNENRAARKARRASRTLTSA